MGKFVYCSQHLRPHGTGWCTVSAKDKIPLKGETLNEAYEDAKEKGLKVLRPDGSPQWEK